MIRTRSNGDCEKSFSSVSWPILACSSLSSASETPPPASAVDADWLDGQDNPLYRLESGVPARSRHARL